jgi:hypothetical protein
LTDITLYQRNGLGYASPITPVKSVKDNSFGFLQSTKSIVSSTIFVADATVNVFVPLTLAVITVVIPKIYVDEVSAVNPAEVEPVKNPLCFAVFVIRRIVGLI